MALPLRCLVVGLWLLPPWLPPLSLGAMSGLGYTLGGPPDQALFILTSGPFGLSSRHLFPLPGTQYQPFPGPPSSLAW